MADVSYSAEFVVLLDKLKQGLVETQKMLDKTEKEFKKAGEEGGKSYAIGITKSIEKFIPSGIKKISHLFESISPKLAESGKQAAMGFAKAFGKLVPAIQPVFTAIIASSAGLYLIVGAIALAIKAIAGAIKKAYNEQVAFNNAVNAQKSALENAKKAIDSINDVSEKTTENYRSGERAAAAQHLIWKKIGDWFSNTFSPVLDGIKNTFQTITNRIGWLADKLGLVSDEEITAAIEAQKLESNYNSINDAATSYQLILKQINLDSTKGDKERLSAAQSYLDTLIEQRVLMAEQVGVDSDQVKVIDDLIERQTRERDLLLEKTSIADNEKKGQEKSIDLDKERLELQKKMQEELAVAEREASRIADQTERENFLRERQNEIYKHTRGELDKLIVQTGATRDSAEETYKFADLLDDKVDETLKKTKELSDIEKYIEDRKAVQLDYDQKMRQIELSLENGLITEAEAAEERNKAADDFNKKLTESAAKYKDLEVAARLAGDIIKSEKTFDYKKLGQSLDKGLSLFQDAAGSVTSITGQMAQDQIEIINNLLEEQKALIDQQYEQTMSKLEEERQAALEAAGFVKTVTEEGLAASLEAALASGDEAVIYREKRRQQELAINKQYDTLEAAAEKKKLDETKAAEEQAAREIAEINYKQALAEWAIKLSMAPVQIASAILQASPNFPVMAAMGVVGALQLAAIIAAMPKKPAFKYGGIVGLPETYQNKYANGGIVEANTPRGVDAVDATLANKEMVLNDGQQRNLFDAINTGSLGGAGAGTVIVQLVVDGEIWAERMVEIINNGATKQIARRMIE